jgi:TrmH family RNA methyltransferase
MTDFRLKRYQKEFEYSYASGVFATLELITHRPEDALKVVITDKSNRNEGVAKLHDVCAARGIPVETDDKTIERVAGKESHLALGVFRKYQSRMDAERNHVALVNPADMGNLGTIARTMIGFGFDQLAVIRPAADLFDPKAIRASMGAIFQLSFETFDTFEAYRAAYPRTIYALMTDGAVSIHAARFEAPYALVFGNESSGLPESFASMGTSISIPHSDRVDSLNLSIAVGIALYEAARK